MKGVFEDTRSILEPAGALALAGLQQYELPGEAHAVAICSGANITFEKLQQVAERTLTGSGREALLSVHMPERPGTCMHSAGKWSRIEVLRSFRIGFSEGRWHMCWSG